MPKVLMIGVTGGTGTRALQGFGEQGWTDLRVLTRRVDPARPAIAQLQQAGLELVEADLDDLDALPAAFAEITHVYCHATSGDYRQADPAEIERAKNVAAAAHQAQIQHLVYNSAGGADRQSNIPHIEHKYQVEKIFQAADLPTTMLRSCLFMEEFWKRYLRPAILKGKFRFAIPPDRPMHLVSARDVGRVAAAVMERGDPYLGRAIELASDVLTPAQMADAFSAVQGKPVKHQENPSWILLLLWRKQLYDLIQWYRNAGYQADLPQLRSEFPGLLSTFESFLRETHWANADLTYDDLATQLGLTDSVSSQAQRSQP
jgi:uncharacterized protein YbjT (DUF2867 family)